MVSVQYSERLRSKEMFQSSRSQVHSFERSEFNKMSTTLIHSITLRVILYSCLIHLSFSGTGEPPVFLSQPEDILLAVLLLRTYRGIQAHIIITCNVTGTPTPNITWYRGESEFAKLIYREKEYVVIGTGDEHEDSDSYLYAGLVDNTSLYLNVTGYNGGLRNDEIFHCRAANTLDESITAIARSRNVSVMFSYFNGFRNEEEKVVEIGTVLGGTVAIKCDVLDAVPVPQIQWFVNGERIVFGSSDHESVMFIDGGRYLYIQSLTAEQRNSQYRCVVANKFSFQRAIAPTTYRLDGNIRMHSITVYKPLEPILLRLKVIEQTVVYYYPAAVPKPDGTASILSISCPTDPNVNIQSNGLVMTIDSLFTKLVESYNVTCELLGSPISPTPKLHLSFTVVAPVNITRPLQDVNDRDRVIRSGRNVVYVCEYQAFPTPIVSWYYNGRPLLTESGVRVRGNEMTIYNPEIRHSGIYQCILENIVDGVRHVDMRSWILELRPSVLFSFLPLTSTNPDAVADPYLGTLLIAGLDTSLDVSIGVKFDNCPVVEWSFNGSSISSGSEYFISDPCESIDDTFTFYFSLTIANLNLSNSGLYVATFSYNDAFSSSTRLFITVPVPVKVLFLDVLVGPEELPCLVAGSTAFLTCHTMGFPRPQLIFTKNSVNIEQGASDRITRDGIAFDKVRIDNIQESDEAQYGCETVETEDRLNRYSARVIFCVPPAIDHFSSSLAENQLVIDCAFSGLPLPDISWIKDDTSLSSGGRFQISSNSSAMSRLTITDLSFFDSGIYTCVGSSEFGRHTQDIPVAIGVTDNLPGGAIAGVVIGVVISIVFIVGILIVVSYLIVKHVRSIQKARRSSEQSRHTSWDLKIIPILVKTSKGTNYRRQSSVYSFHSTYTSTFPDR